MTAIALATAMLVFLRAMQQQNVIGGHYGLAVLTSFGMALAEVSVVLRVVDTGIAAALYVGAGGALGVTAAMYVHKRWVRRRAHG